VEKNLIRITDEEMDGLAKTSLLGEIPMEDLILVVAWAFAQEDETFQEYFIRQIWMQNNGQPRATPPRRKTLKARIYGLARSLGAFFC
jgi:hypothetical protein